MTAPTLDGTATGQASSTTTVSASLTTTNTNDIVCALVYVEKAATTLFLTGVAGGSLTWQRRSLLVDASDGGCLELWWAIAASTLSTTSITATSNVTFDDASILVFGVSGCNTTNPWDANASLPSKQYSHVTNAPSFTNISTTNANDFLIFAAGSSNGWSSIGTVPTGFTAIGFHENGGGSLFASVGAAYQGVTSAQSGQTFTWGSNITGPNQCIFEALTADTGGNTSPAVPVYEVIAYNTATTTSTFALPTAGISSNDVICVMSYCEQSGGGPAITGVSGGGLTFTQRKRSHGSSRGSLELWSAQVTGTLTPSTITVTYAANFDDAAMAVFSVAGCNSMIFDNNAGVPAVASNTSGLSSWTPSVTISTSQAHDMVLVVSASSSSGSTAVPSGFQFFASMVTTAGSQLASFCMAMQRRSSTLTSSAVTWGGAVSDGLGVNNGGEYLVDAITADSGSVSPNINLTGVSSTSAAGTASVAGSASPSLTGVSSTSAVNTPATEIDESPALTGVVSTTAVGTPTFSAGGLSITGVSSSSATGTPSVEIDEGVAITGVEATSAIGTPTVSAFTPANVTGVETDSALGTLALTISSDVTFTGVAATSGFGTVSTYSANLNGVAATVGLGAIVAQSFPVLVGQAATSAAGSPSVYISTINGVQATTGIGVDIVVVTELPTLVGQQIVGLPGFLQALVSTNFTNASITGVGLTSGLGIVGTSHPGPVMAGAAAASGVGALSVTTSAIADIGMTIGQLAVEQSAGTPLVDVDLTVRWSDTEGQSWADSVIKTLGFAGEYNTSIQVRRMGMSRHGRVYELSWSAPFPTALAGATLMFTDAGT